MSMGGSGFIVLIFNDGSEKGQCLAYIQHHHRRGFHGDCGKYSFYEICEHPWWDAVLEDREHFIEELQAGADDGTLGLRKIIRSPTGQLRAKIYDFTKVVITADPDDTELCKDLAIPKHLLIHGREPVAAHSATDEYPIPVLEIK